MANIQELFIFLEFCRFFSKFQVQITFLKFASIFSLMYTTYVVYYTTKAVYYTTNVVQYTTFVVYNFIIFLDFNLKHHGKHSRIVYIFKIFQIFFQIQSRNIIKLYTTNVVYYTTFVVQYTTYVVSYTTFVVYKHCIVYCICSILYNICGIQK